MTTFQITNENSRQRLDVFLAEYFSDVIPDITRSKIPSLIDYFLVNNKAAKPSYKLKEGDIITFNKEDIEKSLAVAPLTPFDFKLDIVFEDNEVIVLNKPKGILTHPTKFDRDNTLVNALLNYCPDNLSDIEGAERLGIVHRLDKDTSGLMLIAKTNTSHISLAKQIKEKTAIRKYFAIALNNFEKKEGIINKPLVHYLKNDVKMVVSDVGLEAITHYKVIEEYKSAALVELELKTGRTHQIRAHLASINHPLFGDDLYGAKGFIKKEFSNLKTKGQLLQSYYLKFKHPISGETKEFQLKEDDFSKDFIKVLNFLRSNYAL